MAGAAVLSLLTIGAAWAILSRPAAIPIDIETEAQIDATQPCHIQVSYFAPDHAIVVIDFPSLLTQGLALDRVAALTEKAGLPRDRLLDDTALRTAIASHGDTVESYYYGHDYPAADLAEFFQLAAQENIRLNPQERWLKTLLTQLGWLKPGANGAIITLPAAGGAVTPEMRAVILHHEISHGAFYTNPAYRQYAVSFWYSLTAADRDAFTSFLGRQGYDTNNTMLMLNETQAYLIFTRDPRFFNADAVGMTQAEIGQLRAGYIAGMPNFWLTPMANAPLPSTAAATACLAAN
ncbi:hypothetical protein GCM10010909_03240 [Acidocella aquatica]|uniref:Uncharacterized protein n=1 Tax=Acidocella aquatica TaxID=1922313 RepID=A0ABQ5ZZK5_9PROT|nr:hypothetical protein [Acidocella aquatica]GLR65646.1 hypothetical protein GCM10010909_03240 [Acidocella aquatica]